MIGMIDLHSHVLPGVDDGARTTDEALALLQASSDSGVTAMALTPHIYSGVFDNALENLQPVFDALVASAQRAGINMKLRLAAEVRLDASIFDRLHAQSLPFLGRLGGDRILLLELPDGQIPPGTIPTIRALIEAGVRPMIAHPERNRAVMADRRRAWALVESGALLQVTAGAVLGQFGRGAAETVHGLLADGMVSVVATDTHNLRHRPPLMKEAWQVIAQRFGIGMAHRLMVERPGDIFAEPSAPQVC